MASFAPTTGGAGLGSVGLSLHRGRSTYMQATVDRIEPALLRLSLYFRTIGKQHLVPTLHVPLHGLQQSIRERILLSLLGRGPWFITILISLGRLPIATALPIPPGQSTETATTYADNNTIDYVVSSSTIVYLVVSFYLALEKKIVNPTRITALALCITTAVFWLAMTADEDARFTTESCWNVLKIWGGTTFAFASLSCHERPGKKSHWFLLQALGISALLEVTGMSMQSFTSGSFLKALPPCLSVGILIASIVSPSDDSNKQAVQGIELTASQSTSNDPQGEQQEQHDTDDSSIFLSSGIEARTQAAAPTSSASSTPPGELQGRGRAPTSTSNSNSRHTPEEVHGEDIRAPPHAGPAEMSDNGCNGPHELGSQHQSVEFSVR